MSDHALLLDRGNLKRRNRVNRVVEVVSTVAALLAVAVLLIVVGSVVSKGIGALSIHFLTTPAGLFGDTSGGISNAIVGTAIIVGLAALMAIPVGLLVAIFTSEFASERVAHPVRFVLDLLNGVPTIVTGIFVFGLMVEREHAERLRRLGGAGDRDAADRRPHRPGGAGPGSRHPEGGCLRARHRSLAHAVCA